MEKPSFIQQLHDTEVSEGSWLCLSCTFSGRPTPQIHWLRNNTLVVSSAIYRVCTVCHVCFIRHIQGVTCFII